MNTFTDLKLREATYRVVDTETTGLDAETARLVEVAYRDHAGDGRLMQTVESLLDPGVPIPPEAMAVHHITDGMVRGHRDAGDFMFAASDDSTVLVAHNAEYDKAVLRDASPWWLCTYRLALHLYPSAPSHKNQVLRYYLGLDVNPRGLPHRAGYDAHVTAALFFHMLDEIEKRASQPDRAHEYSELNTVATLQRWAAAPATLNVIPLGKYRGETFADIAKRDAGYLRWMAGNLNDNPDVQHSAKRALQS